MRIWGTSITIPWWGAVLLLVAAVASLAGVLVIGFMAWVSLQIDRGWERIAEVKNSVGNFTFVNSYEATARLRSTRLYSWEFGFIDVDAMPVLRDEEVTVFIVNHDSRPIRVSWVELGADGMVAGGGDQTIGANSRIEFWSGKYGSYRTVRGDPWFVARPHAVHDVEIILRFQRAPSKPVVITPIVHSTL